MSGNRAIKICADQKSFPEAQAFVEKKLKNRHINAHIANETMVLFESLYNVIVSQVSSNNNELEITSVNGLGSTDIKMVFPGKRFFVPEGDGLEHLDEKIVESFSDKLSCSYSGGLNVIRISVSKSAWSFVLPNFIAVIAALIVSFVLSCVLDKAGQNMIARDWVAPLQKLFTNAVLMISAPMTLFSLLKNVSDSFIVSERHSNSRSLFATSFISSIVAVVIALVIGFVFVQMFLTAMHITEGVSIENGNWSLASLVDQIIPSSILEPFETLSPVPMVVVAILVAAALCIMGKGFDVMKRAADACYDLFSSILEIVMAFFPLACFLLFLEVTLVENAHLYFFDILIVAVVVFVCTIPLLVTYAIRLKVHGVRVLAFTKKLLPLIKENYVMGSVIDAVPYNIRYCTMNFGFSRERLEKELPVLAQINLDGNCFILALVTAIYILMANCHVSWIDIEMIALIALFLSFGAPNQPGSILIGTLIILTYLKSDSIVSLALCFELFCGGLQNILNVISSVVTVAEYEARGE